MFCILFDPFHTHFLFGSDRIKDVCKRLRLKSSECGAALSERCTHLFALFGNNTGVCSFSKLFDFGLAV
jgi:hypothetical protein